MPTRWSGSRSARCRDWLCRSSSGFTRSATELGVILEWLNRSRARFIAVAHGLDTNQVEGHLRHLLVEVSRWESERLRERTRNGLMAARGNGRAVGRPAVVDNPQLRERIVEMRAQGMTLQAIADRLNDEGVPTVRGGAKWRHSSLQVAAGYARRRLTMPAPRVDQTWPVAQGSWARRWATPSRGPHAAGGTAAGL